MGLPREHRKVAAHRVHVVVGQGGGEFREGGGDPGAVGFPVGERAAPGVPVLGAGKRFLAAGDMLELEVEKLGCLRNFVAAG